MAVQVRQNNITEPFVLYGWPAVWMSGQVLKQIGGRTTDLLQYTLMAKITTPVGDQGKWLPLTDVAATDGTAFPRGIYLGEDIPATDIDAGDVAGLSILTGMAEYDVSKLVIENSLALDTVIGPGVLVAHTVRDHLAWLGLYDKDTVSIGGFENAL